MTALHFVNSICRAIQRAEFQGPFQSGRSVTVLVKQIFIWFSFIWFSHSDGYKGVSVSNSI